MPVAIHGPLAGADAEPIHRKLWTRTERDLLVRSELLDPRRFELIEGELIEKVKNHPHIRAVMLVIRWLNQVFATGRVLQEPSIHLAPGDTPNSDPEPDAVVLSRPYDEFYTKAQPEDIILIVEVADSSLHVDSPIKGPLYARAGVPEYWVLDVNRRRLIVYRDPLEGSYRSVTAFDEDEPVAPLGLPIAAVQARNLL